MEAAARHRDPPRTGPRPPLLAALLFCLLAALSCLVLLGFGLLLAALYRPEAGGLDAAGYPVGRDFINLWAGPQLAFRGEVATLFDLRAYHAAIGRLFGRLVPFHNWSYPPFALLLFRPFAELPYFPALALWTLATFAAFAAVVLSAVAPARRPAALLGLVAAPACLMNLVSGQNGFLTAVLLLGGALAIDRRPLLAGVMFGLLAFKPHLGLVLPFALVALGAWRAMAAAALTLAVLVAASAAAFGWEPWGQYLTATRAYQTGLLVEFHGYYARMMVSALAGARAFGLSFAAGSALQVAVALVVVAAACRALRRTDDPVARATVLAAAAPLATPYAFNYDLAALTGALVWWAARSGRPRSPAAALVLLAWLCPALAMLFDPPGLAPLVLAAVFALAVREAGRGALPHAAPSGEARGRPWPARPVSLAQADRRD